MFNLKKRNKEVLFIAERIEAIYSREPWHGKSVKLILSQVDPSTVTQQPAGEHSIIQLVWHMMNWQSFVLHQLKKETKDLQQFEAADWPQFEPTASAWQTVLDEFWNTHNALVAELKKHNDKLLDELVPGRNYNYRNLLFGIRDHDIYHSGQIAYLNKLLAKN